MVFILVPHSCKEHKYAANEIESQREGKRGEKPQYLLPPSFAGGLMGSFPLSSFLDLGHVLIHTEQEEGEEGEK